MKNEAIPKVNNFMWRAAQMALQVKTELARRGIQTTQTCPFCTEVETVSHAMLGCEWVKRVWFGGMGIRPDTGHEKQWDHWLLTLQELGCTGGEMGRRRRLTWETMVWEVWKEQCRTLHHGDAPQPETVIRKATTLAEETWKNIMQAKTAANTRRGTLNLQHWMKPRQGVVKLSCDVA